MTRVTGWQKALKAVVEKHIGLPSQYGVSDCYLICDDAVFAITGERMFADISYDSELAAAKELVKRGFENVEQAFGSKFEAINPLSAQRGDIGVMESDGRICGGVFTAVGFMVRDPSRIVFLPVSKAKTAFKVGR